MEDILDVYKRPYNEQFPVVCMDESSKQLINETRIPISAKPGETARYDTEYQRNGTCNIFIHSEPLRNVPEITSYSWKSYEHPGMGIAL